MKRAYEKPVVETETFTPNEYIASCFALVDVNDSNNYVIKTDWNGTITDGQNYTKNDNKWYWNGKGFGDDHLDELSTKWSESANGIFYDGAGMTHTTAVKTWEANGDVQKGATMVDHMATQVNIVQLTDANSSAYGSSANAS
jgi:hypothetical protein